jgi:alpha-glucuronidase
MILEKLKAFWKKAASDAYATFAFVSGFLPSLNLVNQRNPRTTAIGRTFHPAALIRTVISSIYINMQFGVGGNYAE